ncbi:amidohydrolase [Brevibacterium sp. 50QC2O2]|jgi:predicted amidohydrolase YtcJ|uniref:amidohydrolase n=1 Tax=Brevibacterium sp. 50QC2O2 TaxID=2968459 RepID=UPI00211CC92B|nr:amidohydrolase [Brevibacterium sp. 50QC2O2]MCQ9387364.1 amidohydrolase [Brevibacterium sp. 50QC2O2]
MRIDTIFRGNFHTGEAFPTPTSARLEENRATALAVDRGRIVAVSRKDDLSDFDGISARETVEIDAPLVVPGFHDAHHHTMGTGEQLGAIDLRYPAVTSLDELYAAVEARAKELPAGQWVRGAGYDQNRLGAHPTAEMLDRVGHGHPVILDHVSHHMITANTAAFERAGFPGRRDYPEVDGGVVPRDAAGLPLGLLQEKATEPIQLASAQVTKDEAIANLKRASDQAVSYGLTSLTEPGVILGGAMGTNAPVLDIYQDAVAQGALRPRMTVMPFYQVLHGLEINAEGMRTLDLGIRTGFGDDRLRIGPVKMISDGSLIGRSAAVHECYCGEPENRGVMTVPPEAMPDLIASFHRAGWAVATHAIGDRAIDHALDAIEHAQQSFPREVRHRIEHFSIATDEQVTRCAALGVIPNPQGVFISEFGDGVVDAIGAERAAGTYRMRSLVDAGMVVPGSTDSPVSDANPLKSMHDLVNRRTSSGAPFNPAEAVTIGEALHAYTYGSAYAINREDAVGTLEAGKLADFAVLDADLFGIESARIEDVTVTATVIGGDVAYRA